MSSTFLLQLNEALQPFFSKGVDPKKRRYAADEPHTYRSTRTKKEYCSAVCRALVDGSSNATDQFGPVLSTYAPKVVVQRTDRHEVALAHLTKTIGAALKTSASSISHCRASLASTLLIMPITLASLHPTTPHTSGAVPFNYRPHRAQGCPGKFNADIFLPPENQCHAKGSW